MSVANLTEVDLVQFCEVAIQPVGGLDEAVVHAVRSVSGTASQPRIEGMIVDLVSEVPPLGMSPQLLVGEPQRPVDLVCVCVDPDALRSD